MPPLPVDEHQRVVGGEAAQVGGPREGRRVTDGLDVDVERRNHVAQQVREVGVALLHDLARRDHVDRNWRLGHRSRLCSASDCHEPLQFERHLGERDVKLRDLPLGDGHLPSLGLVADQHDLHCVRACRNVADLECAAGAGVGPQAEVGQADLCPCDGTARASHGDRSSQGSLRRKRPSLTESEDRSQDRCAFLHFAPSFPVPIRPTPCDEIPSG